ncbi:hypothetical protein HYT58_02475 [Candidatus Woesearchaeota archaeon]|nr:hypothetical protein [Candidatus Woesearchaeota archaeon]
MQRIYFLNAMDRNVFFKEIKCCPNLKKWKNIANFLGISKTTLEYYRNGKYCMPEDNFTKLLNTLGDYKRALFLRLVRKKPKNWGCTLGGKKTAFLYPKILEKGRYTAWKKKKKQLKYNFDPNMPLSENLCEFVGVIIGDGFTSKYSGAYQTQITGDGNLDQHYYYNFLKSVCEKLFNITPKIHKKDNTIRLNIYSKKLFEILTKRFGIPPGKKCYNVKIPEEIIKAEKKFLNSTIRGMFNTDGGIGFDRRNTYKKPYIRINYSSASKKLINQLNSILSKYQIPYSLHKRKSKYYINSHITYMIQINGESNVKKFLSEIGFSNNRHLHKLEYLIKN